VKENLSDKPFNKHSLNRDRNTSPLDKGEVHEGVDGIVVNLVQGLDEEAFKKTLSKSVRATLGVDPSEVETEEVWEEMLKGGLQTALESQVVVFEVSGVSRTCTHQLVRSRRAAFHQQSQRASFMGVEPNVRMPKSVANNPKAALAFREAFEAASVAYEIACQEDIAYQDARFVLPEATETYILCEYPLREFFAVYAYRACVMFSWEIVHVVREMGRLLVEAHPWLEPYVKISCEKSQMCTFQGWEDPTGFCDLPWGTHEKRIYKPDRSLRIGG